MGWKIQQNSVFKLLVVFFLCVLIVLPISLADRCASCDEKLNQQTRDYLDTLLVDDQERTYIVKFTDSIDKTVLSGMTINKEIASADVVVVRSRSAAIDSLLASSAVQFVELDQDVQILADVVPWGVDEVNAPAAWSETRGSGVSVGVIDTGIASHTDLIVVGGVSIVGGSYTDTHGHGTAVAGVIAALEDNAGLVGVAPSIDLYSIKVMNDSTGSLSDIIEGVSWAIDNNISILTMSIGFSEYSQLLKEELDDAYDDSGILLIAASGNNGVGEVLYPAAYADVIAVGAVHESLDFANFSNYGFEQELVAPGVGINSTALSDYDVVSGTSFATSHVAGVAALLLGYNQSLTNVELRGILQNSATDLGAIGKDDFFGYGLVYVNLSVTNTTLGNDSYFYEIYNITDYGMESEELHFWLNGTGKIDDVEFTEGYYFIVKHIGDRIKFNMHVSENGTITILATGHLEFIDDYAVEGTFLDAALWVNDELGMRLDTDIAISFPDVDAECYEYDGNANPGTYDICWFPSSTKEDECTGITAKIQCEDQTECIVNSSAIANYHYNIIDESNSIQQDQGAGYFDECEGPVYDHYFTESTTVLIMNKKRSICTNSTHYEYQGNSTGGWTTYVGPTSCGSTGMCDSGLTVITSSRNTVLTPPCITCVANGTINVVVSADGGDLPNAVIWLNNVSQSITPRAGIYGLSLTGESCDANQEIKVYCSDNTTLCGTKSTQLDFNGDEDTLFFDCTLMCGSGNDLSLSQSSISVNLDTDTLLIGINSKGISATVGLNVSLQKGSGPNEGLITASNLTSVSVSPGQTVATVKLEGIETEDFLHIWVDPADSQKGEDNSNNYLFRPALKPFYASLNVSVDPTFNVLNDVIEDYIGSFVNVVDPQVFTPRWHIVVGRPSSPPEWRIKGINFGGKLQKHPYSGTVSVVPNVINNMVCDDTSGTIYVYGDGIEGTVAAVKRLISGRSIFLDGDSACKSFSSTIDDTDPLGIKVFEQFHTSEAKTYFYQNNEGLAEIAENILFDNSFEVAVRTVKTTNQTSYGDETILRVKHLNSDFSENYKDAFGVSSTPVIFSGGLFSNLESWEDGGEGLAIEMANEGYDVWEMEMNGGSTTDECSPLSACPNYTYVDQVDFYWPALVAGITEYSGQNKVDYVGHSNGCGVALRSLNNWSNSGKNNAGYYFDYDTGEYVSSDLPSLPIRTFVGLGCPGNLNGSSKVIDKGKENGDQTIANFYEHEPGHITGRQFARGIGLEFTGFLWPGGRISTNLSSHYNDVVNSDEILDLSNINTSRFYLLGGTDSQYEFGDEDGDDTLIPERDIIEIYNSVQVVDSNYTFFPFTHSGLTTERKTKDYVKNIIGGS